MTGPKITIDMLFGHVKLDSWIEFHQDPNGGHRMVGMGRKRVYDQHGRLTEDKTEPTGLTGWAPYDMTKPAPERRKSWLERLFS